MNSGAGTIGPSQELTVWLVDLPAGELALHDLGEQHGLARPSHPATAATATGLAHVNGRHQAARIALRALLAAHVGLEAARQPFLIGPAGKPRLAIVPGHGAIEFSLSHCEDAALIAFSGSGAVGVDIEASRPVRISADRRAMLENAAALLSTADRLPAEFDDRRFLQAWVRLEALAKATGEGISALLGRLGIRHRSLLSSGTDGVGCQQHFVRDLDLDGQMPWHAAIAGLHRGLGADNPRPVARPLPLDRAFLEDLVRGRAPGFTLETTKAGNSS